MESSLGDIILMGGILSIFLSLGMWSVIFKVLKRSILFVCITHLVIFLLGTVGLKFFGF